MSVLESALQKIRIIHSTLSDDALLEAFPTDRNDSLWTELKNSYSLEVIEISALKNKTCLQSNQGKMTFYYNKLFVHYNNICITLLYFTRLFLIINVSYCNGNIYIYIFFFSVMFN